MAISDKLQHTLDSKNAIKQALIERGAEPGDVFSQYPQVITDLPAGSEVVGTIVDNRLDEDAEGYLKADGSLIDKTAYPDLAAHLWRARQTDNIVDLQSTVSGLPSLTDDGKSVAFSPNGNLLAIGHRSSPYLTIIQVSDWSVVSGTPTLPGTCEKAVFSPDGKFLAVGHNGSPYLTIIRTSDFSEVGSIPPLNSAAKSVSFSKNGQLLAVANDDDPCLTVFRTADWSVVNGTPSYPSGNGSVICFNNDSSLLVLGRTGFPFFTVYNTASWDDAGFPSLTGGVNSVAFSPDDRYMAVGYTDDTYLAVFDISEKGMVTGTPSLPSNGNGVAFSPNGQYLAVGHNALPFITVFKVDDWSEVNGTPTLNDSGQAAAFSPDGQFLAAVHESPSYLTIIPVTQQAPDGYTFLPRVPAKQHGNVFAQPLIKAE